MKASQLRIDKPCHEDWDGMSPDGARRFCDRCDKHVHNLSDMTEAGASALLEERGKQGRLCVRYSVDAGGRVVFKRPVPTVVPLAALTRRRAAPRRGLAPAAAVAMMLAACTPHEPEHTVGELMPITVETKAETEPKPPVAPEQVPDPVPGNAIEPEPRELMGDVAVVDEPCDPPTPKMGKIKRAR